MSPYDEQFDSYFHAAEVSNEGGQAWVRKEAFKEKKLAELAAALKPESGLNWKDILQDQALRDDRQLNYKQKIIERSSSSGTKLSSLEKSRPVPPLPNFESLSKAEIIAEVKKNGYSFEFAPPELKSDVSVVMELLESDPAVLLFASPEIRANRSVVLKAVSKRGSALAAASENLRADRDIVLAAVRQDGESLRFASESLKADREVAVEAIEHDPYYEGTAGRKPAIAYASEALKTNPDFILEAIEAEKAGYNSVVVDYIPKVLFSTREFVLKLVSTRGDTLKYASSSMRSDIDIVLAAVKQDPTAIKYAEKKLLDELYKSFPRAGQD
jgi:lambda repressor-like predicted transcriptional regulator